MNYFASSALLSQVYNRPKLVWTYTGNLQHENHLRSRGCRRQPLRAQSHSCVQARIATASGDRMTRVSVHLVGKTETSATLERLLLPGRSRAARRTDARRLRAHLAHSSERSERPFLVFGTSHGCFENPPRCHGTDDGQSKVEKKRLHAQDRKYRHCTPNAHDPSRDKKRHRCAG